MKNIIIENFNSAPKPTASEIVILTGRWKSEPIVHPK
jgi:hypothetical protein